MSMRNMTIPSDPSATNIAAASAGSAASAAGPAASKGTRTILRRILAVAGLCLAAGLVLAGLTRLNERKDSVFKYEPFFEEEHDFDVLYFGTSHVLSGYFPMELWGEYGYTSYNFGGNGNYLPTTYWVFENALDYTTPKVVIIDCYFMQMQYKTWYSNTEFVHQSMDAFPLSLTKIRGILDLMNDPVMDADEENGTITVVGTGNEKRSAISFLWDLSVYHSRWTELTENDFNTEYTRTKGSETSAWVAETKETIELPADEKLDEETTGMVYLRKIIEECQAQGIEVLLTYLPYPAGEDGWRTANTVSDIADEYGVHYVNFLTLDTVDYDTDFQDYESHLNASGAKKVTSYIGQYLSENYDLTDHREEEDYADWREDFETYRVYKQERYEKLEEDDLTDCLVLLADHMYDAVIDVRGTDVCSDELCRDLLENIGVDAEELTDDTELILVQAVRQAQVIHASDHEGDSYEIDTILGKLSVTQETDDESDASRSLVFLNDSRMFIKKQEQIDSGMVRVCVTDTGDSGSVIYRGAYSTTGSAS